MKLAEALQIVHAPYPPEAPEFSVFLATGFEPLHLKVFLAANLRTLLPARRVTIQGGLFGDLAGSLESGLKGDRDAIGMIVEWPDLDPRFGVRNLGGWHPSLLAEMAQEVATRTTRLLDMVRQAPRGTVIAVSLPTLPMLPVFPQPGRQGGGIELGLRKALAQFAADLGQCPGVRIVSSQRLDLLSPASARHDPRSEVANGFPYHLPHASTMATLLAENITVPAPKKGLITDLDDTLWRGILGEDGLAGISWDLDHKSQMHGLYQQLLASLSAAGVLLGVASKNSLPLVEQALSREDLHLDRTRIFPVEANWQPKSRSIAAILHAWNVGSADVVFVDDSAMELDEVGKAFPDMTCLPFPARDEKGVLDLLWRLRDLFGKEALQAEDLLRSESLRQAVWLKPGIHDEAQLDTLLREARPELVVDFGSDTQDQRAFDLVNKTNQFNLNGRRFTQADWQAFLGQPGAFLMTVAYSDKYGPLGKIAVLAGEVYHGRVQLNSWVMSCRAFSRRIEYQCLKAVFTRFNASEIHFAFAPTDRNQPLQEFLRMLDAGQDQPLDVRTFDERCPPLYHLVKDVHHG